MSGTDFFNNKKIVLIELDYHAEVVQGFQQYAQLYGWEVTYVLSQEVLDKTGFSGDDKIKVVTISKKDIKSFLQQHATLLEQADCILLNTIDNSPGLLLLFDKYLHKTVVRLHNANTTFAPFRFFNFPRSLFLLWKQSSYFVRKIILQNVGFLTSQLLDRVAYILPASHAMSAYVSAHFPSFAHKLLPALPFYPRAENMPAANVADKALLRIVVPGKIDNRRRDYGWIVRMFEQLESIETTIELTFLGGSDTKEGAKVKKAFADIAPTKKLKVFFYEGFVPREAFDKKMRECDFVLCPIKRETVFGITKEFYGSTKVSGNEGDARLYNKMLIGPNDVFEASDNIRTFSRNDVNVINRLLQEI